MRIDDNDDGLRHFGEAICAGCGGSLMKECDFPGASDTIYCAGCGRKATFAEVAKDCEAWYQEYTDFYSQQIALGRDPEAQLEHWKPQGRYRFQVKIVGFGQTEEFAECQPIPLNY